MQNTSQRYLLILLLNPPRPFIKFDRTLIRRLSFNLSNYNSMGSQHFTMIHQEINWHIRCQWIMGTGDSGSKFLRGYHSKGQRHQHRHFSKPFTTTVASVSFSFSGLALQSLGCDNMDISSKSSSRTPQKPLICTPRNNATLAVRCRRSSWEQIKLMVQFN